MLFSKSCEYALRATLYLAKITDNKKVGINIIAKELDIPMAYLSKVMQTLVKHDVVSSSKGRNGGFYLSKNEINKPIISIILAIDGENVFCKCVLGIGDCIDEHPCPLHKEIREYRGNLKLALSNNLIKSAREGIVAETTFLSK